MSYSRWERRDAAAREELGRAALEYCRAQRAHNAKVTGARYLWVDAGNTLVLLVEGQPGFADYDPEPTEALTAAQFKMNDVARQVSSELWTDARLGLEAYERAGRPPGIFDPELCRFCGGIGSVAATDVGGGEDVSTCAACGGTGRTAAAAAAASAR